MNQAVQVVIERYPDRHERIRQLWQADEDFQEMCHDYGLCLEMLQRRSAAAKQREAYLTLQRRLELEIEMKTDNGMENDHEN